MKSDGLELNSATKGLVTLKCLMIMIHDYKCINVKVCLNEVKLVLYFNIAFKSQKLTGTGNPL